MIFRRDVRHWPVVTLLHRPFRNAFLWDALDLLQDFRLAVRHDVRHRHVDTLLFGALGTALRGDVLDHLHCRVDDLHHDALGAALRRDDLKNLKSLLVFLLDEEDRDRDKGSPRAPVLPMTRDIPTTMAIFVHACDRTRARIGREAASNCSRTGMDP